VLVRPRSFVLTALAVLAFVALATGCTPKSSTQGTTAEETRPAEEQVATNSEGETLYTPSYVPTGNETATFTTSRGEFSVKLYGKDAPIHVGNFIELVRKGFYQNNKFHRYVPGFVIQGGDPQTQSLTSEQVIEAVNNQTGGLGTGGPGYVIKGEFDPAVNPNKHTVGAMGMARSNDPDSGGSQFYFALDPLAQLDGNYTVFGQVTDGLDVVKSLRVGDVIENIEIVGATE